MNDNMTPIVMNQNLTWHKPERFMDAQGRDCYGVRPATIYEGPSAADRRLMAQAIASVERDVESCNFAEEDARAERAAHLKGRLVFWGIVAVIGLALVAWKVIG